MFGLDAAAIAAIAATVASTALTVTSSIASGKNQKAMANYRAAAAERESRRQKEAARISRAEGDRKVLEQRRRGELIRSDLQASAAASGFASDSADFLKIDREIAARSDIAGRYGAWEASQRARGFTIDANESRAAAGVYRSQGKAASQNSYLEAAGAGLSGLGGFATKFGGYGKDLGWFGSGAGSGPQPYVEGTWY